MLVLVIVVATLVAYRQAPQFGFLNFDDNSYVTGNAMVRDGLTVRGIVWAFTTGHSANWHPLTWLSHMLDVQLFGMNPRGHHITNLLLHILNTILLYEVLRRMTGYSYRSAIVAALFALHPLHVESVAWVAERKDVLSTFFWMATMLAYHHYTKQPGARRYGIVFILFALGLMAKPMLVTLPCVLLLLDYWPLGRLDREFPTTEASRQQFYWRCLEKLPLIILVVVSSGVTFFVQRAAGAMQSLEMLDPAMRLGNASLAYVLYLVKTVWPGGLAPYYPHPKDLLTAWRVLSSIILLATVFALVSAFMRRWPFLLVGWLWYIGTLVPVIGIVQVGDQALADRYTYIPLIGIFILLVWTVAELTARWKPASLVLSAVGVVWIAVLAALTHHQTQYWRDSEVLFKHTLEVTSEGNIVAYVNLAKAIAQQGRYEEAGRRFVEGLRARPDWLDWYYKQGVDLLQQGKLDQAAHMLWVVTLARPEQANAHISLATVYLMQNRLDESAQHFARAVELQPNDAKAHHSLGLVLERQGKIVEALQQVSEALRLDPNYAIAKQTLARLQSKSRSPEPAGP
ncbi:MAG: tetratricopeptide repeat protein [Candidatus Hydrogenedentes bacterium]|nr:tetratricopeptide repeat protein [Candidatus Hydrogenedentota bacterium]